MGKLWKAREKAGRNLKKARGLGRAARCAFRSPARSGLIPSWAPLGALGALLSAVGRSWGTVGHFWGALGALLGVLVAFWVALGLSGMSFERLSIDFLKISINFLEIFEKKFKFGVNMAPSENIEKT